MYLICNLSTNWNLKRYINTIFSENCKIYDFIIKVIFLKFIT